MRHIWLAPTGEEVCIGGPLQNSACRPTLYRCIQTEGYLPARMQIMLHPFIGSGFVPLNMELFVCRLRAVNTQSSISL